MSRPRKEPHLGKRRGSPHWFILWHDGTRSRRASTDTQDSKVARQKLADFLIRQGEPCKLRHPDELPIAQALRFYIERIQTKRGVVPAITRSKQLIAYFGGNMVDVITPQTCTAYVAHRRTSARATDWTINGELSVLRAAIGRLVKDGELTRAPFVQLLPTPDEKDLWLDTREVDVLVSNCVEPHVRLFVELALYTASRKQAILDMKWLGQIDFKRRLILLKPPGEAKTSKGRPVIPMSDRIEMLLRAAQANAKSPYVIEYAGKHVGDIKVGFWAACRRARRTCLREARRLPIGDEQRQDLLAEACKFKKVTPHTLRHTAGSWIIQETGEIGDTGSWLGHTNERTARIYAHHDPRYLRHVSDVLERRRGGGLAPLALNSAHPGTKNDT